MSNENKRQGASNEELRGAAVQQVLKEHPSSVSVYGNLESFIKKVSVKFLENKLYNFPKLCVEARRVNYLKHKELRQTGDEKGLSPLKSFKFQYVIPRDLYVFMTNMVYHKFWAQDNKKVWASFMKGIMRGDDPVELLKKVKVYYGAVAKIT